jgi:hypothetical protein
MPKATPSMMSRKRPVAGRGIWLDGDSLIMVRSSASHPEILTILLSNQHLQPRQDPDFANNFMEGMANWGGRKLRATLFDSQEGCRWRSVIPVLFPHHWKGKRV